ncbi:hypothetical protein ABIF26_009582 [Bradyrhizobium elkanii]|uniref:hypothetical protein n=1 Tax=Bradyrhizobium elkanii TaxID=29448 RepID=UPI0035185FD5
MAARSVKIRHDEDGRFYVYRIFDGFETVYIGKGSGRRLASQKSKFGLAGEIIARFKSERDAYAFEIKMIAQLMPTANKHPGGNGSRARRKIHRRFGWEIEMDRVGSRRYVARELLKFDLSRMIDASKIDAIREVANGPRI